LAHAKTNERSKSEPFEKIITDVAPKGESQPKERRANSLYCLFLRLRFVVAMFATQTKTVGREGTFIVGNMLNQYFLCLSVCPTSDTLRLRP